MSSGRFVPLATPSLSQGQAGPSSSTNPPNGQEPNGQEVQYTTPSKHQTTLPRSPAAQLPVLTRNPALRYVPPYWHLYSTMAKGRWWNREILELISTEFRDRSLEYYRFALEAGVCTINGRRAKPGDVVKNGDRIQNVVHRHEPPVTGEVKVVSGERERERDMLVVMKPGSVPVHGAGRYYKNSLVEILKSDFGLEKVYTVNRLDRLTSGLMLFATTPQRANELCKQFAENKVKKEYIARVAGEFPEGEISVSQPLLTIDRQMGLVITHPLGKPALTLFRRLHYNPETNESIVYCRPKTGRTHQIRVHLQWLGWPISNDPIYTGAGIWGKEGGKGGIRLPGDGRERGDGNGEGGEEGEEEEGVKGPSVMPEEAARALGLKEGERRVDGLLSRPLGAGGDGVPVGETVPPTPAPVSLASDAELPPTSSSTSNPTDCTTQDSTILSPTPSHPSAPAPVPAPKLLPRETGADIGLSSPVPLSSQAVKIIKSLRDQKDKDEDWARWRDVVFRARDAGVFLRGRAGLGPGLGKAAQTEEDGEQAGAGQQKEGEKEEDDLPAQKLLQQPPETDFHPMLDTATNTLYCPTCYAPLHPDPKPERMYIYLHAWRYTTEEGCWESEWPEWAGEVPVDARPKRGEVDEEVGEGDGGETGRGGDAVGMVGVKGVDEALARLTLADRETAAPVEEGVEAHAVAGVAG